MLHEALEGISIAYKNTLEDACSGSGLLVNEGVENIVELKKVRKPKPKPPTIWVKLIKSMNNQSMSLKESWTLPVALIAIVQDKDQIIGEEKATRLASLARSSILQNRNLDLFYVRDTISKEFDYYDERLIESGHKNLHAHHALMWTRFEVYE